VFVCHKNSFCKDISLISVGKQYTIWCRRLYNKGANLYMGIFENEVYYNRESFGALEFAHQRDVFLRIRSWVATVPLEVRYNNSQYRKTILKRIEQIAGYACSGHIPAQDYMGYIYKRGFSTFFPVNYRRALEWNIIAARNGSKLAPQKMKIFLKLV